MHRTRIAIIGLGMAVTPHARGLIDLSEMVEVAWAYSPSKARRAAFACMAARQANTIAGPSVVPGPG